MRRIQPPKCTSCKTASAMFESDVWPSILLCQRCHSDAIEFIIDSGITHGNPILLELAAPQGNDNEEDRIRIWKRSPLGGSIFSEVWVNRRCESERMIENPLDILNDL